MKLAFNGKGKYTKFSDSFCLYKSRVRDDRCVTEEVYRRVLKQYCEQLADRLEREGMVDLPSGLGMLTVANITRKPRYKAGKFVGYGKKDWETEQYDGTLKAFGIVFLPKRKRNDNLRCYGFVANRRLFQRMKDRYEHGDYEGKMFEFNDDII